MNNLRLLFAGLTDKLTRLVTRGATIDLWVGMFTPGPCWSGQDYTKNVYIKFLNIYTPYKDVKTLPSKACSC